MIRAFAIVAMLALSACAKPSVRVETITAKVPISVACVDRAAYDAVPKILPPIVWTGNAETDVSRATAQGLRWRGIALDLHALMTGCVAP